MLHTSPPAHGVWWSYSAWIGTTDSLFAEYSLLACACVRWPPKDDRARADIPKDLPGLRFVYEICGGDNYLREGPRSRECDEVGFRLALALCGGTLFGHEHGEQPTVRQRTEGADLMRRLAEAGVVDGSCGWAFLLQNGELVPQDTSQAANFHRQAASAGHAQSMHELGTIYCIGRRAVPRTHALV